MNNKKLIIINVITLIIFVTVVGIGLNQSKYTKADPDHKDEEVVDEQVEETEKIMRNVALRQSILKAKLPTALLGLEDELEEDEKDLMELEEMEEEEVDSEDVVDTSIANDSMQVGNTNEKLNNKTNKADKTAKTD